MSFIRLGMITTHLKRTKQKERNNEENKANGTKPSGKKIGSHSFFLLVSFNPILNLAGEKLPCEISTGKNVTGGKLTESVENIGFFLSIRNSCHH